MTTEEFDSMMTDLTRKHGGTRRSLKHIDTGQPYTQFEIMKWLFNIWKPGVFGVPSIVETIGHGRGGYRARVSRAYVSEKFGIPEDALSHFSWNGKKTHAQSAVVFYEQVEDPERIKHLVEWSLGEFGEQELDTYKCQELCISLFEEILGKAKKEARPTWLSEDKGKLRLDGFWSDHKIAVEYNGAQHYRVVPRFHPNGQQDLDAQRARDDRKRRLCKENKVRLVEIPYWANLTRKNVFEYVRDEYPDAAQQILSIMRAPKSG